MQNCQHPFLYVSLDQCCLYRGYTLVSLSCLALPCLLKDGLRGTTNITYISYVHWINIQMKKLKLNLWAPVQTLRLWRPTENVHTRTCDVHILYVDTPLQYKTCPKWFTSPFYVVFNHPSFELGLDRTWIRLGWTGNFWAHSWFFNFYMMISKEEVEWRLDVYPTTSFFISNAPVSWSVPPWLHFFFSLYWYSCMANERRRRWWKGLIRSLFEEAGSETTEHFGLAVLYCTIWATMCKMVIKMCLSLLPNT